MKTALALALAGLASASGSYVATITPIDGSPIEATGYAFFEGEAVDGVVSGFSQASHLEPKIDAASGDCTATNGCGMHIHEGSDCTNSTTQGGHLFDGDADPWATVGYSSTTGTGYSGLVNLKVDLGGSDLDIDGRAFIVHANDGSRIACGILESTELTHEQVAFLA